MGIDHSGEYNGNIVVNIVVNNILVQKIWVVPESWGLLKIDDLKGNILLK